MKVYKISWYNDESGTNLAYRATRKEANELKKQIKVGHKGKTWCEDVDVEHLEFKPTKQGVVSLLNSCTPLLNNG